MKHVRLILAVLGTFVFSGSQAFSQTDVGTVTGGAQDSFLIAVTDFSGSQGAEFSKIIRENLSKSGRFDVAKKETHAQSVSQVLEVLDYQRWLDQTEVDFLVAGTVSGSGESLSVKYFLFDLNTQKQLDAVELKGGLRRIAHMVSDRVYTRLTGEGAYFNSRIVYVSESGPKTSRRKRLAIMDQDGANHSYLTDGVETIITPQISMRGNEIAYIAFTDDQPKAYLYNLRTGQKEVLGEFPGMSFAPSFSSDGRGVLLSMAQNGNTDIFYMDLATRQLRQMTHHPGIDTTPSMSPNGKWVVFNSDRSGTQQLYVMRADGSSQPARISFNDGRYATPKWSPKGDLVAFTRIHKGEFFIGVMKPDGSGEVTLSKGYISEGPTWAPNGRVLAYYRQDKDGDPKVYQVHIKTKKESLVPTPSGASDPSWTPLLN